MDENQSLDDDQIRALEFLNALTSQDGVSHATASDFEGREVTWTRMDVEDLLQDLCDVGYAEKSGRLAGGWRCTRRGRQKVRQLRNSRSSGPERQEHVIRWVLGAVIDHRPVERDDCDVHEEGWSPVTPGERGWALRGLEKLGAVSVTRALGAGMVRVDPREGAEDLLVDSGRSLLDRLHAVEGGPMVHNDNRVGIQTREFYNNGAVATADHATLNVTITNAERQQIAASAAQALAALEDAPIEPERLAPVFDAITGIEEEVNRPEAARGTLRSLGEDLRSAWAGVLGAALGEVSVDGASSAVASLLRWVGA